MQPKLEGEGSPGLRLIEVPDMTRIDKKSITLLLDQTNEWFEKMTQLVLRDRDE